MKPDASLAMLQMPLILKMGIMSGGGGRTGGKVDCKSAEVASFVNMGCTTSRIAAASSLCMGLARLSWPSERLFL
jgi:hypothetical protein